MQVFHYELLLLDLTVVRVNCLIYWALRSAIYDKLGVRNAKEVENDCAREVKTRTNSQQGW